MWMGNPSCRWETPDPDGDPWTQSPRWGWGNLDVDVEPPYADGEPQMWMRNPTCGWRTPDGDGETWMQMESPACGW